MLPSEIETLLRRRLALERVRVTGTGGRFDVLAVGGVFAGMTPLQRQLAVQTALSDGIADGHICALSVDAITPDERQ